MRRSIPLAIGLSLCLSILAISLAVAGTLANIRMGNSPNGPAMTQFPSMTSIVYVIFDYIDLEGEAIRIIVYDNFGTILVDRTKTYTGSGTESIAISPMEGVFPDGRYVTNLYRGGFLSKTIIWEVTEAVGVATPTPRATATPTAVPTATPTDTPTAIPTDTLTVAPRATPTAPPTEMPYPMPEATATPTETPSATPEAMETLPPTPTATAAPIAPTATSPPTLAMVTPVPITPNTTAVPPMPLTATATAMPRPMPAPSPASGLSRLSANAFLYVVIGFTALLALLALGMWRK